MINSWFFKKMCRKMLLFK